MQYPESVDPVSYQVYFSEMKATDLERRQRNGWHRRCITQEIFGCDDSALELNMCGEIVRSELNIAVFDIIYDTFCNIQDALTCIRARMVDSSNGQ